MGTRKSFPHITSTEVWCRLVWWTEALLVDAGCWRFFCWSDIAALSPLMLLARRWANLHHHLQFLLVVYHLGCLYLTVKLLDTGWFAHHCVVLRFQTDRANTAAIYDGAGHTVGRSKAVPTVGWWKLQDAQRRLSPSPVKILSGLTKIHRGII